MFSSQIVALFALAGVVAASPMPDVPLMSRNEASMLTKRDNDNCPNPINGPGWGVVEYDCPHTNTMDSSGDCIQGLTTGREDNYCLSYCEVRGFYFPGPEVTFDYNCEAGEICQLAQSKAVSTSNGWSIDIGDTGTSAGDATNAFNIGASYTYMTTTTYTTTESWSRPANASSECGYWTFVPYYGTSCGTLTTSDTYEEAVPGGDSEWLCQTSPVVSTGNWCNTTPLQDTSGQALGAVVFVNQDCNGGCVLPLDQQDPIYQYPGVSTVQQFCS